VSRGLQGGLLGFTPDAGAAYVSRVDFGNGQSWIVDGQPGSTLYLVGDLAPGELARVYMRIGMTDDWRAAPTGASVDIRVDLAGRSCEDHGDREHIHISDEDDEDEDETPTPSPQPSHTATAGATATATATITPGATQTPVSPTSTATGEGGSPDATGTSTSGES